MNQQISNNRWEQRETISFDEITTINISKIDTIVKNILTNNLEFNWLPLELIDEALIQKKLRDSGIDLLCHDLNIFPTSVIELKKYTIKLPITRTIRQKLDKVPYQIVGFYRETKSIIFTLFLITCLLYYRFDLIGWSLLAAWSMIAMAPIIVHEYWGHNYITPRIKLIGYLLDLCGGLIMLPYPSGPPRQLCRIGHALHHRYFPGPNDLIQYELANNNWFRYIFKFKMNTDTKLHELYRTLSINEYKQIYKNLDWVEKLFEDHTILIITSLHLLLIAILGFHLYVYFILVPIQCRSLLLVFTEFITHKLHTIDQDMPWAYPLVLNSAYHNMHHRHIDKLVLGPKFVRYINPQYYFIRLFYKVNVGII